MTPAWGMVLAVAAAAAAAAVAGARAPARIAVYPTVVDYEIERGAEAGAVFDSALAAELRSRGLDFLEAREVRRARERAIDSVGGYYDPDTGEHIDSLVERAGDITRALLVREHGIRRVLLPRLAVHGVQFTGREARWYGAVERTGGRGGVEGLFLGRHVGGITVITYTLAVGDTAGNRLALGAGGLQLLQRVSGPGLVPRDSLFLDQARNRAAVRRAVDSVQAMLRP